MRNFDLTSSGFHQYSIFAAFTIDKTGFPPRSNNIQYSVPLGFTLIELLVVLVIISIMAAFVGPRIAGSMSNMNLRTASKKIAASLRYARSQAISESRTYEALFDLEENRLMIRGSLTPKDENTEKDGEVDDQVRGQSKGYELPEEVRFEKGISADEEVDSGLFKIIFFSNGGSSGGDLFLGNDRGGQYEIKVDFITGTVRVSEVDRERRAHGA